ncbi:MAG TPA: hypothetical protein P5560_04960, partial [Thermotogota bacterium]|nr:hypothetical protein [Thermotogota bacterium]
VIAFSQVGTNIFVGYGLGLKTTATPDATSIFTSGYTDGMKISLIDVGFLVDYEIADGFSIGAGVGGAIPMGASGLQIVNLDTAGASSTTLKYFFDGLMGVSYSYPLQPVVLRADLLGGISFFDFTRLKDFGFLVKAKFGLGYQMGGFTINVGAGYELRNYNVNFGDGEKGSFSIQSVPIELGITLRF